MGSSIGKITPYSFNTFKTSTSKSKEKQGVKQTMSNEKADLSKLPEGVSEFNIEGYEITLYKKGDKISTQVVGRDYNDINDIHTLVQKELEKGQ